MARIVALALLVLGAWAAVGARLASVRGGEGEAGPAAGYVGAEACAPCHLAVYEAWAASTHATTLRRATTDALPPGVVAGRTVEHPPGATTFESGDGSGPLLRARTTGPDGASHAYPLTHVVGRRRVHMFLTTLPDGRWQVLPGMREEGSDAWFDYTHLIFGGPDADPDRPPVVAPGDPSFWTGPVRAFDARCSRCHLSGRRLYDPPDPGRRPGLSWRALGIDCEACHGPGEDHAAHHGGGGGEDTMTSFRALSREQALGLCLRCHFEAEVVDPGHRLGEDLLEHVRPTLLDDGGRIDAYGRPLELVYDGLPFLASRCADEGGLTCTSCHDAHGSLHPSMLTAPVGSQALCRDCHPAQAADVEAHAHHPAGGPGGRCTDCHMPFLVIERGHGVVSDHSISVPHLDLPGDRVATDACTWCHEGGRGAPAGAPRLAADALRAKHRAWWPDLRPPPDWARTVAAARAATEASEALIAQLRALAESDSAPRVYRATAARLLGRWPSEARAALLGLTAHRDSLVRREAVAALRGVRDAAADAALRTALRDPSWPVRSAAAGAALAGWTRIEADAELCAAVIEVLEADARAVPDDDQRWFRLGAAREIAGDRAGAIRAYERQVALDPLAHAVRRHIETLRASPPR